MKNRTKLWLIMLIGAVGSVFLFVFLSSFVGSFWIKGYNLKTLNSISRETLRSIERQSAFGKEYVAPLLDSVHARNPDLRLEWIASDGSVIYDTSGEQQRYGFQQLADRVVNMPDNLWSEDESVTLTYSLNRNEQSYYLMLSLPSEAMKAGQFLFYARTFEVLYSLVLPLLAAALVPYFLSLWFFSSINRRIGKLNKALNEVSFGSDLIVLAVKSKDEIGQLTRHYNEMAHRIQSQSLQIEQLEDRRKILLSNLSHDLRTPLTMILGYAETIRTGTYQDENELQAGARIILQRSRYMDKLLDQLLDISRQEAGAFELHPAPTNLSELLRKIVSEYLLFLDGQNFAVDVDIPEKDIEASIDASLVERALSNLLDNAIRYGSEGQFIGIRLFEEENEVCITIMDRGKGVSPEDRERIFERFYRADEGRKGAGLGIGLAIVKEIVESHHGRIQVMSTPYVETLFLVRLPKRYAAKGP
ncbi:HAMP domain-containing sensor histidine kinase [Cohnella cholangitidis]|uniref:histidine kinase n=1 Tax=Cohnella cholangitidis TaxID=2598458 RepID=A0A7G5BYK6_9BACL|nr:HAMP domain-containing sensor histidine kinase [Cohnella cholangitidis]QMV42040.1 HAMP domain-containing histidine kinase [Cohnella cholangitidis]